MKRFIDIFAAIKDDFILIVLSVIADVLLVCVIASCGKDCPVGSESNPILPQIPDSVVVVINLN